VLNLVECVEVGVTWKYTGSKYKVKGGGHGDLESSIWRICKGNCVPVCRFACFAVMEAGIIMAIGRKSDGFFVPVFW